jgi:hypothetical protein
MAIDALRVKTVTVFRAPASAPLIVVPEQTGVPGLPAPGRRPEPASQQGPQAVRFVAGADFGWVNDSETPEATGPVIESTNLGVATTGSTFSAGVFVNPEVSVWGEWTKLAPETVAYSGMALCETRGSCTYITDWPSQTGPNEEVAVYELENRMPYSVSGLVGLHLLRSRRMAWTLLAGVTMRPLETTSRDDRYTVTAPGVHVPKPSQSTVEPGGTYGETHVAMALGVEPQIALSSHLTVVPKLRFDLGPEFRRTRAAVGMQWVF